MNDVCVNEIQLHFPFCCFLLLVSFASDFSLLFCTWYNIAYHDSNAMIGMYDNNNPKQKISLRDPDEPHILPVSSTVKGYLELRSTQFYFVNLTSTVVEVEVLLGRRRIQSSIYT